jgi:chain length determinant protein (polysaccharide antigen chain regulator)
MNQQNSSVISKQDADFRDDEINLFDLLTDLQLQKRWFIIPIVSCFLLALLYVSVVKPVYQVKSVVKEVGEGELVELNAPQLQARIIPSNTPGGSDIQRAEIYSMTVSAAYKHATQALLSREYRRDFYEINIEKLKEYQLYNEALTQAQNFNSFNKLLSVKLSNPKKDAESSIELILDLTHPELATELMNDYVEFALGSRVSYMKETLANKMAVRIEALEYDASLIREKYYTGKTFRKLELEEASQIAKKVGQTDSVYSKNDVLSDAGTLPLYLYGSKALIAENNALGNREKISKGLPYGEEHFIQGLPAILFEIQQLKNLKIDFSKVSIAQLDEKATLPSGPIKPRKRLIVMLGLIVGGFLGLMTALLVAAYKRHQKQHDIAEAV